MVGYWVYLESIGREKLNMDITFWSNCWKILGSGQRLLTEGELSGAFIFPEPLKTKSGRDRAQGEMVQQEGTLFCML